MLEFLLDILTLIIFIVILAVSSEEVVKNAAKLARFFRITQLAIGFLLVAVSTSLPELALSVISSSVGKGGIAVGNVFGSNIANILLILGATTFLYKIKINKALLKDISIILLVTTILSAYILLNSVVLGGQALGQIEGFFLLFLFCLYVMYLLRKKKIEDVSLDGLVPKKQALHSFLIFCLAATLVIISAGFVVSSASKIAKTCGVAESFMGATLIAVGTSLPELSIGIQAIRKKHYGLALGDAVGSNMSNLTLVLGSAAALNPISVNINIFSAALIFAVIANMLLLYYGAVEKRLARFNGAVMVGLYILYIILISYLQISAI